MASAAEKRGNGTSLSGHPFDVPHVSVHLNFWALHFHLLIVSKGKHFHSTFPILLSTLVSSSVTHRFESRNKYLMNWRTFGSS